MSQVGAQIRAILAIDLFRLLPAGYTPLCAVSYTNQYEPKHPGVPKEGESGEVHLITDRSLVDLGEGEATPLYKFYFDQALKQHILGRRLNSLPFAVSHTKPASWLACLETFYENYEFMRVHLRAKEYDLDKRGLVDPLSEDAGFGKRYDKVNSLWQAITMFLMAKPQERDDVGLGHYISGMDEAYRNLYLNVPPLSFGYLPDEQCAADALMYVMQAEEGARLFLGWQGETDNAEGCRARIDMLEEKDATARQYMNEAVARAGFAYAIPPMFPYGMTGGVEALIVKPALKTYMIDDWGRSLPGDWWKQYAGIRSKAVYEAARKGGASRPEGAQASHRESVRLLRRLFEECVIPREILGIGRNQNGIFRHRIVDGPALNAFDFHRFLTRFVTLKKGADTFHLRAYADFAMAWVVLGGAMTVTSPSGIELDLKKGDACLFPASVSGDFRVEVHKSPLQYMAITSPRTAMRAP